MAACEQRLFDSGMPVAALMEKVGLAMAAWLLARRDLLRHGVVVLVGPGHNGGDGLVVARELHLAGVEVSLWCPLPIRKPLTAEHLRHGEWLGLQRLADEPDPGGAALWLDAVFGLGQSRPLPEFLADLFRRRQQLQPGALISLDRRQAFVPTKEPCWASRQPVPRSPSALAGSSAGCVWTRPVPGWVRWCGSIWACRLR